MNYSRQGIKKLGLSFMGVLVATAFATAGAQAEIAREWLINGQSFVALSITKEEVAGEIPGTEATVTLLVSKLAIEIACKKGAFTGTPLITTAGQGTGSMLFSECLARSQFGGLEVLEACTIPNIAVSGKVLSILHKGVIYVVIEPQKAPFGFVKATGEECMLPEEAALNGKIVTTMSAGEAVTQLVTVQGAAAELLLETELRYGAHIARLHGDAKVFLLGENIGKPWRVH